MSENVRPRTRRSWPSIAGTAAQRASRGLARLEDITRLISEWVWETDKQGEITYVSDRVSEALGVVPVQIVSKTFKELGTFITVDGEEAELDWKNPFRDKLFQTQNKSGEKKLFLISGIPYFDPETWDFEGFSGTAQDITVSQQQEQALREAHDNLEARVSERTRELRENEHELITSKEQADIANRAKSEFLANMSHELRTPLNAILGFSEMLANETFGPLGHEKNLEYAASIYASGVHLTQIITDILDLSKIEANEMSMEETAVDIPRAVTSCISMISHRAKVEGVTLTSDIYDRIPFIRADVRHLKQIIINLLSNAIKFTPAGGGVTVGAELNEDQSIEITITDTGVGIAPEDIPKVLLPFGQVAESHRRKHGGTGLGLGICNSLVKLHDGNLDIKSELGKGTTVSIKFPAERTI